MGVGVGVVQRAKKKKRVVGVVSRARASGHEATHERCHIQRGSRRKPPGRECGEVARRLSVGFQPNVGRNSCLAKAPFVLFTDETRAEADDTHARSRSTCRKGVAQTNQTHLEHIVETTAASTLHARRATRQPFRRVPSPAYLAAFGQVSSRCFARADLPISAIRPLARPFIPASTASSGLACLRHSCLGQRLPRREALLCGSDRRGDGSVPEAGGPFLEDRTVHRSRAGTASGLGYVKRGTSPGTCERTCDAARPPAASLPHPSRLALGNRRK